MAARSARGDGPELRLHLLDHLAERGAASLHARGREATRVLLDELPEAGSGPVLEVGCGTGETSVRLSGFATMVVAADVSERMLGKTLGRSRWCGVRARLRAVQLSRDGCLPFASSVFSAVVVESVLAIQPPDTLRRLARECARVVQRGGRVLVNETVWMEGAPRKLAEEINRRSADSVGVIQAVLDPFDAGDWRNCFEASGLRLIREVRLDGATPSRPRRPEGRGVVLRSRAFTAWSRLRALKAEGGLAEQLLAARVLANLAPPQRCLEGILFVLEPADPLPRAEGR